MLPELATTVPVPEPVFATMTLSLVRLKLPFTVAADVMTSVAGFVLPVIAPDHELNDETPEPVPWNESDVPCSTVAVQMLPLVVQSSTDDESTVRRTATVPLPAIVTVNVYERRAKVAVTFLAAVVETTQVPMPVQPSPDQPENTEAESGAAVSVTIAPWL